METEIELSLPIYRAQSLYTDKFIEGQLSHETIKVEKNGEKDVYLPTDDYYISSQSGWNHDLIDIDTLAIHLPDMIDKDGNKLFASLSKTGQGGDTVIDVAFDMVLTFDGRDGTQINYTDFKGIHFTPLNTLTRTGIFEGELNVK